MNKLKISFKFELFRIFTSFLILITLSNLNVLKAQKVSKSPLDFNDYKPIGSDGELPEKLKTSSSIKAQEALKRIKVSGKKRKERKAEEAHAVQVSFFEDQILSSGQILFGNPIADYVQKVGQYLIKDQDDLRNELQFYVLKSHVPNAYTTSNGMVVVSIGLLVRLENESQLAVILAHEIQHYIKKHSLVQFKETQKAISETRGNSSLDDKLKSMYRFSKDHEYEADNLGYEMLKKTEYDLNEGIYVFEMLKYTDYPFLETPFTIDSLSNQSYVFPKTTLDLTQSLLQSAIEKEQNLENSDEDELESTHPSLSQRILVLRDRIAKLDMKGKKKFIMDEHSFHLMQKIARHEQLLLHIRRADYGQAFYLSKVMELLYGKSLFLSKIKAMSIYALAEHRFKGHDLKDYGCSVLENKGEWRNLFAGINALTENELSVLAAKVVWEEWSKYPQDEFLLNVRDHVFNSLQVKGKIRLTDFIEFNSQINTSKNQENTVVNSPSNTINSTENPEKLENNGLLKNPRSRIQLSNNSNANNTEGSNNERPYYVAAFAEINNLLELNKYIDKIKIDFDDLTNKKSVKLTPTQLREKEKQLKKIKYKEPNPDFNGLVLLQPQVAYTNSYSSPKKKSFFAKDKFTKNLTKLWYDVARKTKINLNIIENTAGSEISTSTLNEYALLNDWLMERINNDTSQMLLYYSQYTQKYMAGYQTNLLGWTGVDYKIFPPEFVAIALIVSVIYFPMIPVYLYFQLQPNAYYEDYFVVFDTKSSKLVYKNSKYYEKKASNIFLKSQIYESMYELMHTK